MKTTLSLIFVFLVLTTVSKGQTQKNLTPSRGHYKRLESFDPKPKTPNDPLDKLRFASSEEEIQRRMSLKPIYLKNVTLEDFNIPDMPANSSARTRAEIKYLLALQRQRNEEEIRECLYMADIYYNLRIRPGDAEYPRYRKNLFHIGRSIGSWFNPYNLPVTADLMARVWQDASYFIWALKFKYARIRPVVIDSVVRNQQVTDWAAYPSGHASNSYINAYIYQELAPEFTDVFIKDAYDMAHSREIIGVHYPSDSESARIFARQFVNMLFKNEQFLKDFQAVKAEWEAKAKEDFR